MVTSAGTSATVSEVDSAGISDIASYLVSILFSSTGVADSYYTDS